MNKDTLITNTLEQLEHLNELDVIKVTDEMLDISVRLSNRRAASK